MEANFMEENINEKIITEKDRLRKKMLRRRLSMPHDEMIRMSSIICRKLASVPEFISAGTVMLYSAFRNEVCLNGLLHKLMDEKTVFFPKIEGRMIVPYAVRDMSSLVLNDYGLCEPVPGSERAGSEKIDVVVVPGVAFDKRMNRIGFGKGFYDRFLSQDSQTKALKIGLAYSFQVVDELPVMPHDAVMDMIVTEKDVLRRM